MDTTLSDQEVHTELVKQAYTKEGFDELVKLVWALPDQFWVRVCKRLIATAIVGIQPTPPLQNGTVQFATAGYVRVAPTHGCPSE